MEILPHAVFEVLGLADVDDLAFGLHQIAARGIRQGPYLPFQRRGGHQGRISFLRASIAPESTSCPL